jgi:hypothetical protein
MLLTKPLFTPACCRQISKLGVTCFLCTGGMKNGDFGAAVGAWARAQADGTLQGRTLFRPPSAPTPTPMPASASAPAPGAAVREFPAFSMSQPFAALLAKGIKTVETRRAATFAALPVGAWVALHVGRRDWPDPAQTHLDVLRERGMTDAEAAAACALPEPFQVRRQDCGGWQTWSKNRPHHSLPLHLLLFAARAGGGVNTSGGNAPSHGRRQARTRTRDVRARGGPRSLPHARGEGAATRVGEADGSQLMKCSPVAASLFLSVYPAPFFAGCVAQARHECRRQARCVHRASAFRPPPRRHQSVIDEGLEKSTSTWLFGTILRFMPFTGPLKWKCN